MGPRSMPWGLVGLNSTSHGTSPYTMVYRELYMKIRGIPPVLSVSRVFLVEVEIMGYP